MKQNTVDVDHLILDYKKTESIDILKSLISKHYGALLYLYTTYLKYDRVPNDSVSVAIRSLRRILFDQNPPIPNIYNVLNWLRESYDKEDLHNDITVMLIDTFKEVELMNGIYPVKSYMERKIKTFIRKLSKDMIPSGYRINIGTSSTKFTQNRSSNVVVYEKFLTYYKEKGLNIKQLKMLYYNIIGYTDKEISEMMDYDINYIKKTRSNIKKKIRDMGIDKFMENIIS